MGFYCFIYYTPTPAYTDTQENVGNVLNMTTYQSYFDSESLKFHTVRLCFLITLFHPKMVQRSYKTRGSNSGW